MNIELIECRCNIEDEYCQLHDCLCTEIENPFCPIHRPIHRKEPKRYYKYKKDNYKNKEKFCCENFKKGMEEIDNHIIFCSNRVAAPKYTSLFFKYCPWCGKKIKPETRE